MGNDKRELNILYLSNATYGGWVSFTANLIHILKDNFRIKLMKLGNKTEAKGRSFGYGLNYQNVNINDTRNLKNILITAVDKNHIKFLKKFIGSKIIIHDPAELKNDEIIKNLKEFKVITIRKKVNEFLENKYQVRSNTLLHPFFKWDLGNKLQRGRNGCISISRIDFDKNIDILLNANKILEEKDKIQLYGFQNSRYVFFKLQGLNFDKYYKGSFEKSYSFMTNMLTEKKFIIDLSTIKNDGMGTQYTFLEAIYCGCCLILNKKWFGCNKYEELIPDKNCLTVENALDIKNIIESNFNFDLLINNSFKIIENHSNPNDWIKELQR